MNYAVIGVQDDIETSLCVMAAYVPLFFTRALKIYKTMGVDQFMNPENRNLRTKRELKSDVKTSSPVTFRKLLKFMKNETPHKQNISVLARRILTKNMTLEYEFYEFIKQRLKLQVGHLRKQVFLRNWCYDIWDMIMSPWI